MIPPEVINRALNNPLIAARVGRVESAVRSIESRVQDGEGAADTSSSFQTTPDLPKIKLSGEVSFPWSKLSFGYRLSFDYGTSETTCTVYPGNVCIHGIATIGTPETDVVLLAETCTVYAQVERGAWGDSGTILVSASPASSSNTHYRFPLYTFTLNPGAVKHALSKVHNIGDIHLDTPVM